MTEHLAEETIQAAVSLLQQQLTMAYAARTLGVEYQSLRWAVQRRLGPEAYGTLVQRRGKRRTPPEETGGENNAKVTPARP